MILTPLQAKRPLIPAPAGPWTAAARIVGDGRRVLNDFCLIQDGLGRWHCIGIQYPETTLFHAIGERLTSPFIELSSVESGDSAAQSMWASFAIREDGGKALLYYCHSNEMMNTSVFSLRMLAAESRTMESWKPYAGDRLEEGNIVFREPGCRDACVFWDEGLSCYLMYYAANTPENPLTQVLANTPASVIKARASRDLYHWSPPRVVMEIPPAYQAAESPFVLCRAGYYYLWVSGFDYGRMSLYISRDPFHFGDPARNRIMEQSGHAPEIVSLGGVDYVACCAIATRMGNEPGHHDLRGIYLQPLAWTPADDEARAKITAPSS